MQLTTPREIGLYVRERRKRLGLTQVSLAGAAGVSRRWLSDLEAGKPSAEVGLVFKVLHTLGLRLDVKVDQVPPGEVDLDEHLRRYGGDRG